MTCFRYYKERFDIQDYDGLKQKLINLTRPSFSSRTSLKRKLDNAAQDARKKESKTVTDSLNEFKKECSASNYRLCVQCHQFFLARAVTEIQYDDSLYESLHLEQNKQLQRMGKFWCCLGKLSIINIHQHNFLILFIDFSLSKFIKACRN